MQQKGDSHFPFVASVFLSVTHDGANNFRLASLNANSVRSRGKVQLISDVNFNSFSSHELNLIANY